MDNNKILFAMLEDTKKMVDACINKLPYMIYSDMVTQSRLPEQQAALKKEIDNLNSVKMKQISMRTDIDIDPKF